MIVTRTAVATDAPICWESESIDDALLVSDPLTVANVEAETGTKMSPKPKPPIASAQPNVQNVETGVVACAMSTPATATSANPVAITNRGAILIRPIAMTAIGMNTMIDAARTSTRL